MTASEELTVPPPPPHWEADVVAAEQTGRGTTHPWRLTLSDGQVEHDAHFQSVDRNEGPRRFGDRYERNFVDSYRYNIAAYRLAELLGLGEMMPKTLFDTTLNPRKRRLLRVTIPSDEQLQTEKTVAGLMGKDAGVRFSFIMDRAGNAQDLDI